jgi:hypothetical protein
VKLCLGRLAANGILTNDGKLALDSDDQEEAEFAVNLVLIIGCAAGVFERGELNKDGEAIFPAPPEEPTSIARE